MIPIRIALCDDDPIVLEQVDAMLRKFAAKNPAYDIIISTFSSASRLMDQIEKKKSYHVYLLDIIMPDFDGISIGKAIRQEDSSAFIIFLTSSLNFALQSYEIGAFQYLLKPIQEEMLFWVLEKVLALMSSEIAERLMVRTREGITAVPYWHILWAEYVNHSICLHLYDGTIITSVTSRKSFNETLGELLEDERFVKCHMSYVVNMAFVRTLTARDFILDNNSIIPISRKNYSYVRERYVNFLLNGQ